MSRSSSFLIILKFYFTLHQDVLVFDLMKLQLLNKRCYNQYIPTVMNQLKLNLESPPCKLPDFERDLQDQILEKKESGVTMRTGHVITFKIKKEIRQNSQMNSEMKRFLNEHPSVDSNYKWTGEFWVIRDSRLNATVVRFESRNKEKWSKIKSNCNALSLK